MVEFLFYFIPLSSLLALAIILTTLFIIPSLKRQKAAKRKKLSLPLMFASGLHKKYFVILIPILVVGGWFYWFHYRPTSIRGRCAEYAKNKVTKFKIDKKLKLQDGSYIYPSIKQQKELYDFVYETCIKERGLK